MAHQRKVIRHKVRDILDGATAAAARVYASRATPFRGGELPAIAVYTLDEDVDREQSKTAPRELYRELSLVIAAWVSPGEGVDDRMDDLAEQVETAMDADPYLAGEVAECILESTAMGLREQGEKMLGVVLLTYAVTYRTAAPKTPTDGELDDFERAHETAQPPGSHPDDAPADTFEVRTP